MASLRIDERNHLETLALMQPGDDGQIDLLATLLRRPAWMAEAHCTNLAVEFVPAARGPNKPPSQAEEAAIAVCRTCPVRQECLDYAREHHELGVWGGTTERQRAQMTDRASA